MYKENFDGTVNRTDQEAVSNQLPVPLLGSMVQYVRNLTEPQKQALLTQIKEGMRKDPTVVALQEEAAPLLEGLKNIIIENQDQYEEWADILLKIKNIKGRLESETTVITTIGHAIHKATIGEKSDILSPLINAENDITRSINRYLQEQERIRLELERKAQEEARKREKEERERLLKEAAKLEKKGLDDLALERLEQATNVYIPTPVVNTPTTARTGNGTVSGRDTLDIQVGNERELLRAVLDGITVGEGDEKRTLTIPIGVVEFKQGPLKNFVKDNKLKNGDVPGLRIIRGVGVNTRLRN